MNVEFDSNAMDDALNKDNLDWTFDKPTHSNFSTIYIIEKKKKVLVNNDGVECEKCNKKVPIKYYFGNADDEMWVECIHTGWYCPNHSPTSNCDDDECKCCN